MLRGSHREAVLAGAAYVLLALVFWWPLPADAATATIAHPFGDPLLNAWTLAWDADRILHGFRDYWRGLFFYPYSDTVAYSEHLLGIAVFSAPLQWLTGQPILVINVVTIASTALAGWGTFLLARLLTGRADAAFLAGVAIACSPYRLAHAYHLQVLVSGWMPIALYGLHRFLASPSRNSLALFVAAFVLQGLSNGYFLYFTAIPVAVVALHGLWHARHEPGVRAIGLAAAALAILCAIAPVALAYMRVRREQGLTRTLSDIVTYSATPEAYAHVSSRAWLWGGLLPPGREELQLFPGLLVTVLALAAVTAALMFRSAAQATRAPRLAAHDRSVVLLYLATAGLMCILSLGPQPALFGWRLPFAGPYAWLVAVVPGLDGLRVPARMATGVHLGLAVLAAFGFVSVTGGARSLVRHGAFVLCAVLVAAEGYGGLQAVQPFPTADMRQDAAAYVWLSSQPRGALLELPVGDFTLGTRYLYGTLSHGNRIVNGYSGYGSALQDFVAGPPFTEIGRLPFALEMARALGIRWIVVHPTLYEHPVAGEGVADAIARCSTHVASARRFGTTLVAELRAGSAASTQTPDTRASLIGRDAFRITSSMNPGDIEKAVDGDLRTRWASGSRQGTGEAITLSFHSVADIAHLRLDLGARSFGDYPRGLVVESSVDGSTWQTLFDGDILNRLGQSVAREPRTPGIDVPLPGNRTRQLRLRTMGETRVWFWSVDELRVWQRQNASDRASP